MKEIKFNLNGTEISETIINSCQTKGELIELLVKIEEHISITSNKITQLKVQHFENGTDNYKQIHKFDSFKKLLSLTKLKITTRLAEIKEQNRLQREIRKQEYLKTKDRLFIDILKEIVPNELFKKAINILEERYDYL